MHVHVLSDSLSNRNQVTIQDVAKHDPVLRTGVRNHNDVKKKYYTISQEAFLSFKSLNIEPQASRKVCRDLFQVKVNFSLAISTIL